MIVSVVASLTAAGAVAALVTAGRVAVLERPDLPVRASGAAAPADPRLQRWLRRAGVTAWVLRVAGSTESDMAVGWVAVGALTALGMSVVLLLLPGPGRALVPAVAFLVLRSPRFFRTRSVRARRRAIDAELTQFLDALAAASTAGLSARLGMRRAADVVRGPLREELDAALRSVDLGARWRDELKGIADRADLPDLRRAVAVITRTETLGSSLATSTMELADRVRSIRQQRATERARTAPVKMLFPLVFLVLPSFLLLTVVPVLLTTLQSIR